MSTQARWAARITRAVAGEIRQRRKARGMSAEDLAAACADLGMPIPRSTLADLENGRRASISVAEWLALAAALDVPPVMLLCPVGTAETAEVLPGAEAPAFRAAQWVAGEAPLRDPGRADVLTDWRPAAGPGAPLLAYRLNDAAARDQLTAAGRARRYQDLAAGAATEGERAGYEAAAQAQLAEAARALDEGERVRGWASGQGWLAPPPIRMHTVTTAPSPRTGAGRAARGRARHHARPGRSALVVPDLADLRGPVAGTVELPLWLFWSRPDHTFDLDDPDMRQWLYEIVLREASSLEDLTTYLDRDTLIALWPRLYLPKGVRLAWEDRHAALRSAAAVA
jgi:transcriptional regulator with XRE-family HTH domain